MGVGGGREGEWREGKKNENKNCCEGRKGTGRKRLRGSEGWKNVLWCVEEEETFVVLWEWVRKFVIEMLGEKLKVKNNWWGFEACKKTRGKETFKWQHLEEINVSECIFWVYGKLMMY